MTRLPFAIPFVVVLAGCSSNDAHSLAPISSGESTVGYVTVLVNVSGDPTAGFGSYSLNFDGSSWNTIAPNRETQFAVLVGQHRITLSSGPWCSGVGDNSYLGQFSGNSMPRIAFAVNCPSLSGSGTLELTVSVSGSSPPLEVPVTLNRMNGSPMSVTLKAPTDKTSQHSVPLGLYRMAFAGNCTAPTGLLFPSVGLLAVRRESRNLARVSLTCR